MPFNSTELRPPVALFLYNRFDHTRKTIEALQRNLGAADTILYIFSDGPKNYSDKEKILNIREYIKKTDGFKDIRIIERATNLGLAESIITGVSEVFINSQKIIVLEDDLITSLQFLNYMNHCLSFYEVNKGIGSICGYNFPESTLKIPPKYKYPVYFSFRPGSWGWGTWKDRWSKVDWMVKDYNDFLRDKKKIKSFNRGGNDLTNMLISQMNKKIDSWAIRWTYHHYKEGLYAIYPTVALIMNTGLDGSGTHYKAPGNLQYQINKFRVFDFENLPGSIILNKRIIKGFKNIFKQKMTVKQKVKSFIKKLSVYYLMANTFTRINRNDT